LEWARPDGTIHGMTGMRTASRLAWALGGLTVVILPTVRLSQSDASLTFEVIDDGKGSEPGAAGRGSALQGIADRLAALGGKLVLRTAPGQGTTIRGTVPVEATS
jgi:glucose-6-phosphate-specific signal transduction histidine kinase